MPKTMCQIHEQNHRYVHRGWGSGGKNITQPNNTKENDLWKQSFGTKLKVKREDEGVQDGSGEGDLPCISTQNCNKSHAYIHLSLEK